MIFNDLINRQTSQTENTMKVQKIVEQTIQKVTLNMHKTRQAAVISCIQSILNGSPVCVTGIGRGISNSAYEKHKIKRADRLCSNSFLRLSSTSIYQLMTSEFRQLSSAPIILVDWSDLDDRQENFLLRASMAIDGRAITLYQEVHTIKTKEKRKTHLRFLKQLKSMFNHSTKAIIVTDAGFRCPWFQQVREVGWDFVGRVRNRTQYQLSNGTTWTPVKQLHIGASKTAKCIGEVKLAKSNPTKLNLVVYKKAKKGRHKFNRKGDVSRWTNSKRAADREREPWLLATSLKQTNTLAKKAVGIYQTRMQIELTFRDTKNPYYGLGFSVNRTRSVDRISVLILLASIASLILTLIGMISEKLGIHRRFQANTVENKRVLSFHYLGLRVYQNINKLIGIKNWEGIKSIIKSQIPRLEI